MAHGPTEPIDWQGELARHDRWLRTVVLARVGERGAVDEVMQELALAVIRGQAPLMVRDKLSPWLYRLAVRQSLVYRRKQGRRRKLTQRFVERQRPSDLDLRTPDPLQWLLAEEESELVRHAIARLPPRDAEILLLKYGQDWTYAQLAAHLGQTESAIESRLHRARTKLRQQLSTNQDITAPQIAKVDR